MNRILLGIVAAAALVGAPALAADMALKARPAPPPPAFSWTGFYVGGFAGGAATGSVSNPDATNPGTVGVFPPGTPVTGCNFGAGPGLTPGCFATYALKPSFIGGGTAGYNWEFGKLITGIEGEYGYLHLKGTGQLPFIGGVPCGSALNPCDVFFSTQAGNWFGTITGRLGVTADTLNLPWLGGTHTLFYGKIGAAVSKVAVSEFSAGSAVTGAVPFGFSGAKDVWGLAAGGGVEWAFNQSWSLKAEYEYLELRKTIAACGSLPPSAAGAGGPWCTQGGIGGVQSAKIGINYRFNAWPMAAQ